MKKFTNPTHASMATLTQAPFSLSEAKPLRPGQFIDQQFEKFAKDHCQDVRDGRALFYFFAGLKHTLMKPLTNPLALRDRI